MTILFFFEPSNSTIPRSGFCHTIHSSKWRSKCPVLYLTDVVAIWTLSRVCWSYPIDMVRRVPALVAILVGIVEDIRVQIVEARLPQFVLTEKRIVRSLFHSSQYETDSVSLSDESRVEKQVTGVIIALRMYQLLSQRAIKKGRS